EQTALVWLAAAPVVVINLDYVWPKLLATSFLLLAIRAALDRRSAFVIGGWSALAYLSHPVGGLFLPVLGLFVARLAWPVARRPARRWTTLRRVVACALAGGAILAPWLAFKGWVAFRDPFVDYPLGDGHGYATAANVVSWLHSRWDNLWLTLVPAGFFF